MRVFRALAASATVVAVLSSMAACSPELNWRESRADAQGVRAMFPCRPVQRDRSVNFEGRPLRVAMQSCEAAGVLFAVSSAAVGDASRADAVLLEWQRAVAENLGARAVVIGPPQVRGMTASAVATTVRIDGRTPDGAPLVEQAAFFARGDSVFQAAVVARDWNQEAADTFFEGLGLP